MTPWSSTMPRRCGESFYGLMDNDEFVGAITYGPNDPKKVAYRFATVQTMLGEVIGADAY